MVCTYENLVDILSDDVRRIEAKKSKCSVSVVLGQPL